MTKLDTPLNTLLVPGRCLIEASAGTGKTRAITTLVARWVVEKERKIDSILVVTFTKAATAELRERIRRTFKSLQDCIAHGEDSGDEAAELLRQWRKEGKLDDRHIGKLVSETLLDIDSANVRTIHSFCQRALGEFALEMGFPFGFEYKGKGVAAESVVQQMWREKFLRSSKLAARCLDEESFMPGQLAAWFERLRTQPDPELRGFPERAVDFPGAERRFLDSLAKIRAMWKEHRAEFTKIMCESKALKQNIYQPTSVRNNLKRIELIFASDNKLPRLKELREKAVYFSGEKLKKSLRKEASAPENPLFEGFDGLVAACDNLEREFAEWKLESRREVLEQAGERIARRVRDLRDIGHDDLLAEMRDALRGDKGEFLAARLRERFPVVLIDESQDTDPLQTRIFESIYAQGGPNNDTSFYIVGDPKQSIYRFRGADIFAYLSTGREATKRLRLPTNYRSAPALVNAVNEIFNVPLAFTLPELKFKPVEAGRKDEDALELNAGTALGINREPLQIKLVSQIKDKGEAENFFADHCAQEIAALLRLSREGGAALNGKPLRARDFAVLVRDRDEGSEMVKALRKYKVNCAEIERTSVFGTLEAEQFHSLLRSLTNPERQDYRRIALTADMFGLDSTQLLALSEDDEFWSSWKERFEQLRKVWRDGGVGAMLLRALADTTPTATSAGLRRAGAECGGARNLLKCADGPRRLTNLRHLTEILQQVETENRLSPAGLVAWLERERGKAATDDDETRLLRLDSDEDLVKILTVFVSKGLEFPIVYLPFAWRSVTVKNRNEREDQPKSYHRRADGHFPVVLDGAPDDKAGRRWEMEQFSEHLRLLYVALTRARERCVVAWSRVGGKKDEAKKSADWSGRHLPALAWLLHRIREENERLASLSGIRSDYAISSEVIKVYDEIRERFPNGANDQFEEQVDELAERCAGVFVEKLELKTNAAPKVTELDHNGSGAELACREFRRPLRRRRQMTSFSSLTAQHGQAAATLNPHLEPEASDHDADEAVVIESQPESAAAAESQEQTPNDAFHFPRGVHVGQCLHSIFELLDEDRRQDLEELCESQLRRHGLDAKWVGTARTMIENALTTELHEPGHSTFRLGEIEQKLVELEFTFPLNDAGKTQLAAVLERHGYGHSLDVEEDAAPINGFLRGFIDLSFAHGGRWYVLDYKSNWLGNQPDDYDPEDLSKSMMKHNYALQYLLYLLALHRFLGSRLTDYDYDRHMGGAFYLFLRGMDPRLGMDRGVYFDRPTRECIEDLDRLMRGGGA